MTLHPPGYFGKIPARGDFVSCRVPAPTAAAWDGWLTQLTVSVREAAGAAWPEAWLTAPLWHFALGEGVLGEGCVAGVLVASVDRVGRMFPFTVLGPSPGEPEAAWSDAVEALVLEALQDGFDPAWLEEELARVGAPCGGAAVAPGTGVWWCHGSDQMGGRRMVVRGLPGPEACVGMVLGGG